ncbi:hypothetical protein LZ30DRAFT_364559 [Colletotrichum cereale]|nr:hypothetical protein LZ30DRAFT_364559 [Colletotrichum cereale]
MSRNLCNRDMRRLPRFLPTCPAGIVPDPRAAEPWPSLSHLSHLAPTSAVAKPPSSGTAFVYRASPLSRFSLQSTYPRTLIPTYSNKGKGRGRNPPPISARSEDSWTTNTYLCSIGLTASGGHGTPFVGLILCTCQHSQTDVCHAKRDWLVEFGIMQEACRGGGGLPLPQICSTCSGSPSLDEPICGSRETDQSGRGRYNCNSDIEIVAMGKVPEFGADLHSVIVVTIDCLPRGPYDHGQDEHLQHRISTLWISTAQQSTARHGT